jgi:hypothetical protein
VPNFDIIEPKITHRKARGKRSLNSANPQDELAATRIKLDGLGKRFNLEIQPNRNLLDPHFVYLTRNENRSEIMSDEHVTAQLDCFYQGKAEYRTKNGKRKKTLSQGSVAINLCGGLVTFAKSF